MFTASAECVGAVIVYSKTHETVSNRLLFPFFISEGERSWILGAASPFGADPDRNIY